MSVVILFVVVASVAGQVSDTTPELLRSHPERDADGPYWVAASYAFLPDGTVRSKRRIGTARASGLAERLQWPLPERFKAISEDTPWTELGCENSVEEDASFRERSRSPVQTVFPPGDFRGWVAATDAVVLGTVTGLVPGFDQRGWPNTLVRLDATEHLYMSSKYPHFVKYVILPFARFLAAGRPFCAPDGIHQEYYPEVGDRLLIAADLPADRDGLAMTVMGMSRVVQVEADGDLVTYGRSERFPVVFSPDFPVTLDEARERAWHVWRDGFVDLADTLGHEEFTRLWRGLKNGAAEAVRSECFVVGAHPVQDGWTLSTSCPPSSARENAEDIAEGSGA